MVFAHYAIDGATFSGHTGREFARRETAKIAQAYHQKLGYEFRS